MTIAVGVSKKLAFKKETTWGTAAGASGAQYLRRVSSDLNFVINSYQSNEIRPDLQISDNRHGPRSAAGNINGEMSPGTYSVFNAAMCRQDFATFTAITGASITVATSGSYYTLTRAAGSFLTDGVKRGMVVQLTAGSFAAPNLNKNLLVLDVTSATVLTVTPLNGSTMTAEGPISSATLSMPGKKTFVPTSGHTNDSFTIEHWFSDISISHLYTGCRVGQVQHNLPATGMATVQYGFMGKGRTRDVSQYFTSPTAATTTGVEAAVNGLLSLNGATYALVTGAQFTVNLNRTPGQVIGSNSAADIFGGSIIVSGQFSAYFADDTFQAMLDNETEAALALVLTVDNTASANFESFVFPRIKVQTAGINDGQIGLIQQLNFTALLSTTGGAGNKDEATTLWMQDTLA
jgi:hypothetical protein